MVDGDSPEQVVYGVLEAAGNALLAVDGTGVIRYCNSLSEKLFGYAADELVGVPVEVLVPAGHADAHVGQRREYFKHPTTRAMDRHQDLRGRRKDGTEFHADVMLTPWTTSDGPWVLATVFDVSRRREAEARLREQSQTYLMLAKVNEAVATADDAKGLFHGVCHDAVVYGDLLGAWVLERTEEGAVITGGAGPLAAQLAVVRAGRGSAPAPGPSTGDDAAADGSGWSGFPNAALLDAMAADHPVFINDLSQIPEIGHHEAAMFGAQAFAALPLRSRGRHVATLCMASTRAGTFEDDLHPLLMGAADTISLALDRFEARAELDRAVADRTELLRRLVDAQERERTNIAADVHDQPVQSLAAVDLRLGLLRRKADLGASDLVPDITAIHDIISLVSRQLRHLLFELEPIEERARLTDLLEDAARHIFEPSPVDWRVENEPDPRELSMSSELRTTAVRIAKEAMTNVVRHAGASTISIRVHVEENGVAVRIDDDGVGIPSGVTRSPAGHRGLTGMMDRAAVAGGRLTVEPAEPGTRVSYWLPLS